MKKPRLKREDLESCLDKHWNGNEDGIFNRFNSPSLRRPEIVEEIPDAPYQTAGYDFIRRTLMITPHFLEDMARGLVPGQLLLDRAMRTILSHEVGHYALFPREFSDQIFIIASVATQYREKTEPLFYIYADLANEGMLLASGIEDIDIIRMRECGAREEDIRIEKIKKGLEGIKEGTKKAIDPTNPFINRVINSQRIMCGMYQQKFQGSIEYTWPQYTPQEKELLEKLNKVQFVNLTTREHVANFFIFCDIMKEYIKTPPPKSGILGGGDDGGGGSGHGSRCGMPSLKDIPKDELDKALGDILIKYGPNAYKRSKRYMGRMKGEPQPSQSKQAGTESAGEITWNDDLIEMYKLWALRHPVYVAPRPIVKDIETTADQGRKEYEIGDPIAKTDIFASRGFIGFPGLSRIRTETSEPIPERTMSIPDLLIGIDSSGSMRPPGYIMGSPQCLAGSIIGRSYWRSNSHIGVWNFSTDLVYLPPQRDYETFMHVLLGYWGGGTFPDMEALRTLLSTTEYGDKMRFMSPEQQMRMLSPEDQRGVMKKDLFVKTPLIAEKMKKLDNVLITDGYLANPQEVLEHLGQLAGITRNFVFITDKASYEKWQEIQLPNTFVQLATESNDLIKLSLGHCRDMRYSKCP